MTKENNYMNDTIILEAVRHLRMANKIPHLCVYLPSEELSDGRIVFLCDTHENNAPNPLPAWVSFYVHIEPSDLSLSPQPIDQKAKLGPTMTPQIRVTARVMFRIWEEYKAIMKP